MWSSAKGCGRPRRLPPPTAIPSRLRIPSLDGQQRQARTRDRAKETRDRQHRLPAEADRGRRAKMNDLIELRDIYKTYHLGEVDLPVLKGVSLKIAGASW